MGRLSRSTGTGNDLETLITGIRGVVWEADPKTLTFTYVSPRADMFGFPRDAWFEPGFWEATIDPRDRQTTVERCSRAIAEAADHDLEYRVVTADGSILWIRDIVNVEAENGVPVKLSGVMLDVTEQKAEEAELREAEERYRVLSELVSDFVFRIRLLDRGSEVEWASESVSALLGYTLEEVNAMGGHEAIVHPDHRQAMAESRASVLEKGTSTLEVPFMKKDGSAVWLRIFTRLVRHADGTALVYGAAQDVTQARELEEQLRSSEAQAKRLAVLDDLTSLRNRRAFETVAAHEYNVALRQRELLSLIFIDVDGLKKVNDTLGHRTGDLLLKDVASVLTRTFRLSDLVARVGGDEFCVLVRSDNPGVGDLLVERLQRKIEDFNLTIERPYDLSLSVGLATSYPDAPISIAELWDRADRAMYAAKSANR